MPHSLTLPLIAAATLVGGAATGIALGHSTVAEINPKHFGAGDDAASQFYGDLAPNRRADWGQVAAAELQQAATAPPPVTNTAATWPAAPAPLHDPNVDRALAQAWREVRAPAPQPRFVETVVYEQAERPDPVPERVHRYASYPVYRDAPPPPPPPEDEDEGPGGDAATQ